MLHLACFTVNSMAAVQRRLFTAEAAVRSPDHGPLLVARKLDFVSFFLEVPRDECLRAVKFWCHKLQELANKRFVRVKDRVWTQQDKETGFRNIPGEGDVCQILRRHIDATGWSCFPISSLPDVLALDFQSRMQSDRRIWQQRKGISMGSPWGTVACRAWCCFREYRSRFLLNWARSLKSDHSRGHALAPWTVMRWVDDRWWTLRCACAETAKAVTACDVLTYSGAPLRYCHPIAVLSLRACDSLDAVSGFVRSVAAFLGTSVDQTNETPNQVVGIDVAFVDPDTDIALHPMTAHGLADSLDEGIWIPAQQVAVSSRMTTKCTDQLGDDWTKASRPQPRFASRMTDIRRCPERTTMLLGWMARLADCSFSFASWSTTVSDRHVAAGSVASTWQLQALNALVRELVLCGWPKSNCVQAINRALASALVREPTSMVLHRITVLKAFREVVSDMWDACGAVGRPDD